MSLSDLRPDPPAWALEAGLPEPEENESFVAYTRRLGLDVEKLLADLTDQTAPLANVRLGSRLMRLIPDAYERHLAQLVAKHGVSSPERKRRTENLARSLFGKDYRARKSIRDSA
jgi:hypothetical protein